MASVSPSLALANQPASVVLDLDLSTTHRLGDIPSPQTPVDDEPHCLLVSSTMAKTSPEYADLVALGRRRRLRRLGLFSFIVAISVAAVVTTVSLVHRSQKLPPGAFRYRSYGQIVDAMLALEAKYPQYVEVFTAQERYGLPLRDELMCSHNGTSKPCEHYVIKITDESTLPDAQRPEVFFSGALHGDERVGPQSAIALAELLVTNAANSSGIPWLQHLVKTRTIVIMPTTNAYGYDQNTREELDVDPNRDFPYQKTASACFKSMVTRAVNEVWRSHLFQLSITWHGGTQSVSYEWGSTNHAVKNDRDEDVGSQVSPDDRGQFFVALGLSRYSGKFEDDDTYYPSGRMNDIVYAVEGGMEDWAYAASWENNFTTPQPIGQCEPETLGGYAKDKSVYNNATHRAFNILVETSNDKEPEEITLGDAQALSESALADYLPTDKSIGHVPRNVRLALFYIDIVQPYLQWKATPEATVNQSSSTPFEWEVAGSIIVDKTFLSISTSSNMAKPTTTTVQSGVTRWYNAEMAESSPAKTNNKGIFTEHVIFPAPGVYYVQASATVDQNWAEQPLAPTPNVKPQTHVVNARTNPDWEFSANNKTVSGKVVWTSPVVQVVVK